VRVLIVSDIHANLAAFDAVLRDAAARGPIDVVWNLGDCVGYGPQPVECIARLRELRALMVAGNHERAATGAISTADFNPNAAAAAAWTRDQLGEEEVSYLDALPEVTRAKVGQDAGQDPEFTLVHGTLREPIWEYLHSHDAAIGHLRLQETALGLVGHTHVPMLVLEDEAAAQGCELYHLADGEAVELTAGRKMVINPGSVGQPRDRDPRAAYAMYDTERAVVTLHRVEYDIGATQALMEAAGLPRWLIERLSAGR
jgi:diadenosine tetraphosphatase ApaH/serine/threonine PP2A family protein phosphatase